jgi:hypothetical protein
MILRRVTWGNICWIRSTSASRARDDDDVDEPPRGEGVDEEGAEKKK